MVLPDLVAAKFKVLYYIIRKFLFSKIYHAPRIFNQATTNFLGVESIVQLLRSTPDYNQLIHPLSVDFFANIKFSPAEIREQGHFEAIIIGELIENKFYHPDAQYIIFIGGNTTCYQIFVSSMIALHNKLKKDNTKAYIFGFNPPGVGLSPGEITGPDEYKDAGKSIINNLLDNGVKPNQICIYGHSLGAAIGSLIAAEYQNERMDIAYFADRTMGRITDVVEAKIKNGIPITFLKNTLGNLIVIILKFLANVFTLDINVAKYVADINASSPNRALGMNTDKDEVIGDCGLMDKVPTPLLDNFKKFMLADSDLCRRTHSKPHSKLFSHDGGETAEAYVYNSIRGFFPKITY
jgi:hypothetical protein